MGPRRWLTTRVGPVLAILAAVALGAPMAAPAQEYPPGGAELGCSATTVQPGESVVCAVADGTFEPGSPVEATLSSSGGQALGLAVVNVTALAPLAQQGDSFTLTQQVTAAEDGSAEASFQIPLDAVLGAVAVTFEGTAPDGSPQRVSESGTIEVVAAEETLPETGADAQPLVWIVTALLVVGGLVVWGVRRRGGDREEAPVG